MAAKVALYREACSSYETAASAAPGDGELQLHWGETISEMLVLSASVPSEGTAAEMRTLFEAAEARFNEALKCPADIDTEVLVAQARLHYEYSRGALDASCIGPADALRAVR